MGAQFFYRDINAPKPNRPNHIGTSVIIESDNKILLEHRTDSDTWAVIGGGVKIDESLMECAIREKLLGFVMINTYVQKCDSGHSIAEFMVIPKYRRNKIGKRAAIACFEKYEGNWEVEPSYGSEKAYLFWRNVINEYTKFNKVYSDGIFSFSR